MSRLVLASICLVVLSGCVCDMVREPDTFGVICKRSNSNASSEAIFSEEGKERVEVPVECVED